MKTKNFSYKLRMLTTPNGLNYLVSICILQFELFQVKLPLQYNIIKSYVHKVTYIYICSFLDEDYFRSKSLLVYYNNKHSFQPPTSDPRPQVANYPPPPQPTFNCNNVNWSLILYQLVHTVKWYTSNLVFIRYL